MSKYNSWLELGISDRSDRPGPVRPGCRSSGRHNSLIRTPNWTFYICISIVSTRSIQWWSPTSNLTNLTRPVWPVYMRGLTGLPRLSRKYSSFQFWVSTYAPLFLGKACIPRNISPSPKMHLNNEKHLRTNHVLLSKGRYHISAMSSCVSETSLSIYNLGCESCPSKELLRSI